MGVVDGSMAVGERSPAVTVIRSSDVDPGERREYWRHTICDTLGPLDLRIGGGAPLVGEIATARLGPIGVARIVTTTPHAVRRTTGLIRRDASETVRLVLPIAGTARLAQDGRSTTITPASFTMYDFSRPYVLDYTGAVELAVYSIPRSRLPVPADAVRDLTAAPISAVDGAGALTAPLFARLVRDIDRYDTATAARLSTVVLELVTVLLGERLEGAAPPTTALMPRLCAFIDSHLPDPDLTPAVVAAAHHISPRSLHRLFAAEETTVSRWIRQRRLERCRLDLADPRLRRLSVSTIAARWGMPNSAHFSRLFRAVHGMPPSVYREMVDAAR